MDERVIRDLGTFYDRLGSLGGKRVLVIGHGHSAAHAVMALDGLARAERGTRIVWAVRSGNRRPCLEVGCDPLPERAKVASGANALAERPPEYLRVERRAHVQRFETDRDGKDGATLVVTLTGGRRIEADAIVSLTGYRPDLEMLGELAVDISAVTEGAAGIARAMANVTDCLAAPAIGAGDLQSGEPGFYLIGAKSYGRARTFLLNNGYAQIAAILDLLSNN